MMVFVGGEGEILDCLVVVSLHGTETHNKAITSSVVLFGSVVTRERLRPIRILFRIVL
jgi:hypothetical protein